MNLSKKLAEISPSLTLGLSAKAKALQQQGIDIINFGAGEPDFDTPEFIKQSAKTALDQGFTKYTPSSGIIELKQAICKKFKADNSIDYTPENIVVSCGAKHSLYNIIMSICNPGDEVILPGPYWVSYFEQINLASAKAVIINTEETANFKITADDLKKSFTKHTRALILTSPSNPTGMVYTKTELQKIADVVLSVPDMVVISDEIYEKISYDDTEVISIASLSKEIKDRTIIVNGVSKTYSMTGWRIGYLATTDSALVKMINNFQDHTTSNPTSIAQKAAITALTGDQTIVTMMISEFKERRDYIVSELNKINGITCLKPQGAFYVFPNILQLLNKKFNNETTELIDSRFHGNDRNLDSLLRGNDRKDGSDREDRNEPIKSSIKLSDLLLEHAKIAVVPGIAFGADNYLRFSYATSLDNIKKGIKKFTEFVKNLV